MHDAFTVGIPVLAILFGILWNQQGIRDLKSEMKSDTNSLRSDINSRFNTLEGRIDRVQADLSQFYRILGEHGRPSTS